MTSNDLGRDIKVHEKWCSNYKISLQSERENKENLSKRSSKGQWAKEIFDEKELRPFFCRNYSPFPSFSLPLRKKGIE